MNLIKTCFMKLIKYLCLVSLLLFGSSCEEEMPSMYEGQESAYIYTSDGSRAEAHSFFIVPESQMRDTVWITVQAMGRTSAEKRSFVLTQTNVGQDSAAISGRHYIAFNDPEMMPYLFITEDSAQARIPIILLRTKDMELTKIKLVLAIEENEYFEAIHLPAYADYTITTTAVAEKPERWDIYLRRSFGEWGSRKMKFMTDVTGVTDWNIDPDSQYEAYLVARCKNALNEYNETHEVKLAEADGTLVEFP